MLLVIPCFRSTPNIEKIAEDLKRRGSYPEHDLLVISHRQDEELAYQIADTLKDSFNKVSTESLEGKYLTANHLANAMLSAAMRFYKAYKPDPVHPADAPMMYFHSLFRPVRVGWLNEIQAEFYLKGAPAVFGRSQLLDIRTDRNQKIENPRRITVGPLVFGRKCLDKLPLLNFLDEKQHWRERMIFELAAGMTETKQIGPGGKSLLREMQPAKIEA